MFDAETVALAARIVEEGRGRGLTLATVESCTGGLISGAVTEVAGSSAVLERAFVTYSPGAKTGMVGVSPRLIARHGVVSEEVAEAMALGGIVHAPTDIAVAVTGYAGPGEDGAPHGLVCLGVARRVPRPPDGRAAPADLALRSRAERHVFPGARSEIRRAAVRRALEMVLEEIRAPA